MWSPRWPSPSTGTPPLSPCLLVGSSGMRKPAVGYQRHSYRAEVGEPGRRAARDHRGRRRSSGGANLAAVLVPWAYEPPHPEKVIEDEEPGAREPATTAAQPV